MIPRPSDRMIADVDWLDGLKQTNGDMSFMPIMAMDDGIHLMVERGAGRDPHVSPRVATRGDVRMFAESLGVTLIEPGTTYLVHQCKGCGCLIHESCNWCGECLCEEDGL